MLRKDDEAMSVKIANNKKMQCTEVSEEKKHLMKLRKLSRMSLNRVQLRGYYWSSVSVLIGCNLPTLDSNHW